MWLCLYEVGVLRTVPTCTEAIDSFIVPFYVGFCIVTGVFLFYIVLHNVCAVSKLLSLSNSSNITTFYWAHSEVRVQKKTGIGWSQIFLSVTKMLYSLWIVIDLISGVYSHYLHGLQVLLLYIISHVSCLSLAELAWLRGSNAKIFLSNFSTHLQMHIFPMSKISILFHIALLKICLFESRTRKNCCIFKSRIHCEPTSYWFPVVFSSEWRCSAWPLRQSRSRKNSSIRFVRCEHKIEIGACQQQGLHHCLPL